MAGGYLYEPDESEVLKELLHRNFHVQAYRILLESSAAEQGARMTAMDGATRNAGELIKKLTIYYNKTRQAVITKELMDIVGGANPLTRGVVSPSPDATDVVWTVHQYCRPDSSRGPAYATNACCAERTVWSQTTSSPVVAASSFPATMIRYAV